MSITNEGIETTISAQSTKNDRIVKIIGWYEIVGGTIGILLMFILSIRMLSLMQFISFLIYFIFAVLFLLSLLAGVFLLKNNNKGERLSTVVQILQIPKFMIHGTAYTFVAGAKFTLQLYSSAGTKGFKLDFGIFSEFNLYINSIFDGYLIGVNLVPIVIIYLLHKNSRSKSLNVIQPTEVSH